MNTQTAVPDLLATITAAARAAVAAREVLCPMTRLADEQRFRPRGAAFVNALRSGPAPRIIAECKRRSPSRGILRSQYEPVEHARAYAAAGAAAISVLTEPTFFDGDPAHLAAIRTAIPTPLLRKDFIVTEYQVRESAAIGADAVLLIAAALDPRELRRLHEIAVGLGLAVLVEAHTRDEVSQAVEAGAVLIGVNSRNLRTLAVDLEVTAALASEIPDGVVAIAESGITSGADLRRLGALGYDAFLVGERLISQPDPGAALEALRHS